MNLYNELLAKPGKVHKLKDFDTSFTGGLKKDQAVDLLEESKAKLIELQEMFYSYDRYSVLVIFQALDAAGKDGTISHVMSGLNPQYCEVHNFKQPTPKELDHDFLWRINNCLPERGKIGIFNRSHYEEVIATKVHPEWILKQQLPKINSLKDISKNFWMDRYETINNFEKHLINSGTIIIKFLLNISKDEQKKRFIERIDEEEKNWKFSLSDMPERQHWDEYSKAFSDMLTHTSTEYAPWHVIPADRKWFMRYAVGRIIAEKMESLNLSYPKISKEAKAKLQEAKQQLLAED